MREFRSEADKKSCIAKAVFEERGYYIVNTIDCGIFLTPFTSPYNSLLLHKCPSTHGVYNHTSYMHRMSIDLNHLLNPGPKKCKMCNIWIPDSVQTLWTLQNADYLDSSIEGDAGFK